jgi:outer membrane lipoprotein SlyB
MNTPIAKSSAHPLVIVAAVAITLFSLVGIGAVMGWIPTSTGSQAPAAAVPPVAQAPEQPAAPVTPPKVASHPKTKKPPVHVAEAMVPPPPPPPAALPPQAAICGECGVIESVREIKKDGDSAAGTVGGALLGGILGHQAGNGRGRDAMTVLGAVGGAVAGNQIEKKATASSEYRIVVRFEDGTSRTYPSATAPAWKIGDKVRVVNGVIQAKG